MPFSIRVCLSSVFFTDICRYVMEENLMSQHQMNYCIIHRKISLLCWASNKRLLLFDTLPFGGSYLARGVEKKPSLMLNLIPQVRWHLPKQRSCSPSQVSLQAWWTENMGLEDCRVKTLESWWIDNTCFNAFSPPDHTIFQKLVNLCPSYQSSAWSLWFLQWKQCHATINQFNLAQTYSGH